MRLKKFAVSRIRPGPLDSQTTKDGGGRKSEPNKKKNKKKNITKNHALQTKQSTQPPSPISISKSNPLTALLKPASECKVLIREGSLAHSTGPKYLRECFFYYRVKAQSN